MSGARVLARKRDAVAIAPYDARWRFAFARERERLRATLGTLALAIEHVGSTAVPGLAAKPVIDILVGLRALADTPAAVAAVAPLGYRLLERWSTPERVFCQRRSHGLRAQHLHLMVGDAADWRRMTAFRDRLRRLPGEALAYARLKHRLAERHRRDIAAYVAGKGAFIRERADRP